MRPIYDEIIKYIKSQPARFHMPAHFGENGDSLLYASSRFDITELPFSDNLQNPCGIIRQSEELTAADYSAKRCYYFTTGSTTAIYCALGAVRAYARDIIVMRASHKSTYSALRFFGFNPHYVAPRFDGGIPLPVTAAEVEKAIVDCPTAKAVVITSPNYFGQCAESSIADVCKKHDKLLIVDGAHGAHFAYSSALPTGFTGVADITVVSMHKTLPVYSGGAALFCNNACLFDNLQGLRADLHTTSPSYLIMAAMDYCADEYRENGESIYKKLRSEIDALKAKLPNIEFLRNNDFTRLVLKVGTNGFAALAARNVVPEMTYGDYAVFIVNERNGDKLNEIALALNGLKPELSADVAPHFPSPVCGDVTDRTEYVELDNAVGRTSAKEAGVYPPGIPVVAYGEVITAEIAEILKSADTFGFVNNKICVTINK